MTWFVRFLGNPSHVGSENRWAWRAFRSRHNELSASVKIATENAMISKTCKTEQSWKIKSDEINSAARLRGEGELSHWVTKEAEKLSGKLSLMEFFNFSILFQGSFCSQFLKLSLKLNSIFKANSQCKLQLSAFLPSNNVKFLRRNNECLISLSFHCWQTATPLERGNELGGKVNWNPQHSSTLDRRLGDGN